MTRPRPIPPRTALLGACLALLLLAAACTPEFQAAMRQAAQEMQKGLQAQSGGGDDDGARQLNVFGQRVEARAESGSPLDSLLKLVAQDVGVDPDEGSVQRAIWRVRVMKLNLATARRSLDNAREEIFTLAATAEEKRALAELDASLECADDDGRDELLLQRKVFQEEAIERSKADGRLEERRLDGEQLTRVGLLFYNLGVGAVCDNLAIRHGSRVVSDFERVKRDLFDAGGSTGAMAWLGLAAWHQEFLQVPSDMGRVVQEAPMQLKAIGAMLGTIGVLKRNNELPAQEGGLPIDSFEELEDF